MMGMLSNKIKAGVYKEGKFTLFRLNTGWWLIFKYFDTDHERLATTEQFTNLIKAREWCKNNCNNT